MTFSDQGTAAHPGVRTDRFVIRPIAVADAALDYAAVIESREMLRLWSQSSWPEDDFTVQDNAGDMHKMEQRHAAGEAFSYTVMNLAEDECLGCIYMFATDFRMFDDATVTSLAGADWSHVAATVYFWTKTPLGADGTDRDVFDTLRAWLVNDWQLARHVFVTNDRLVDQVAMLEAAGLAQQFTIVSPGDEAAELAYG